MSAPYREMFIETAPVRPGSGHCPWCRAAVDFNANERIAICPACNATFATAIARWTDPPPEARTRPVSVPPTENAASSTSMEWSLDDIPAETSTTHMEPDDEPDQDLDDQLPVYSAGTRSVALIAFLAAELMLAVTWLVAVTR